MKKIKLVRQEDPAGCAVAAIAMALGLGYEAVRKDFLNSFDEDGISSSEIIDYLRDHGCSVLAKTKAAIQHVDFAKDDMLKPFANDHIVIIKTRFDATSNHAVYMDKEGKIHCPDGMTDQEVRDSYIVGEVFGIYK